MEARLKYVTKKAAVWTHGGRSMTTTEWARELGIRADSLRARIRRGYTIGEAVTAARFIRMKRTFRQMSSSRSDTPRVLAAELAE